MKEKFEALVGKIPGLLELEIGIDVSRIDYACDVVLYSVFQSTDALRDYGNHPLHLKVRDELAGMRIARYQVDYPIRAELATA
ncbi:Dabb family protein [Aureimonas flava]|uniref:Dabb family protein n=1 Tax=Aureimonas flava TaxID=2320271 RepID=UPI001FE0AAA4|nr:Dabb family protein [Aureimonas flava]